MDDRLRGELENPNLYYQNTLTFNPVSASHWIKKDFFDRVDSDVLTHHSTYLDNLFIDPAYHARMQRRKELDPEGYEVYGRGVWGELGGLILKNWKVQDFSRRYDAFHKMVYGVDYGFNHPFVILEVGFRESEIYICREIYVHEKTTNEVIDIAERRQFDKRFPMWADSARRLALNLANCWELLTA